MGVHVRHYAIHPKIGLASLVQSTVAVALHAYAYPVVALVCHPSTNLSPLPVDTGVALDTCDAV